MVSYKDIQGIIALAIRNNRSGFIYAMNSTGHPVPDSISEDDLYTAGLQVLSENGVQGIQQVLNRVPPVKATITTEMKQALAAKFAPANQRSFGDWFNNTVTFFGDLIGGSSIGNVAPVVQNAISSSALSPGILGLIVVAGIILIALFRKYTAVVVGIVVIVLAVVLYGIFAKNVTTTTQGGGSQTQTHNGVGQAILAFITGLG